MAPSFVGAFGLCFLLPFEFDWRQHPVSHMLALRIVEHFDIVEYILPFLVARSVGLALGPFAFERVEEVLRHTAMSSACNTMSVV